MTGAGNGATDDGPHGAAVHGAAPGVAPRNVPLGEAGRPPSLDELELLAEARRVAGYAYAPYSGFRVGAVVAAADGRRFSGVNVENASYPVGQCAERVALGALATSGERRVTVVAVAAASGADLLPCGACLQALAELGRPVIVARAEGRPLAFELRELLPVPFAPPAARAADADHGDADHGEPAAAAPAAAALGAEAVGDGTPTLVPATKDAAGPPAGTELGSDRSSR